MRRILLAGLALLCACASSAEDPDPAAARPRNVVFLLADDMQWNAIGALGADIETPSLDRLVAEGTTFTRCVHQGSPHGAVCMPSRSMIWTGRHLGRRGGDQCGDHQLWGQTLRGAGYATFGTGKWHNGEAALERNFEFVGRTGGGMLHSTPNGGDGYLRDTKGAPWPADDTSLKGHWIEHHGELRHSSEVWAEETIRFLDERPADQPFFAYLGFHAPHDPRQAPTAYLDAHPAVTRDVPPNFLPRHPFDNGALRLRDEQLAPWPRTPEAIQLHLEEYHAIVSHMDAQVGRVLEALDERGLADDTLVVFAADHGLSVGQHGLLGKQSLYDHSLRAPMILRGPGVPRGERRNGLVYLHSLYATVCDLVGVEAPASVDAPSLVEMLADPEARVHPHVVSSYADTQRCLRDERYKLIVYPQVREVQLFDLERDPFETHNLAGEPDHREVVGDMLAALRGWMDVTEDGLDRARLDGAEGWALTSLAPDDQPDAPNVVVILADDLGYGDVGALNATSRVPTPNLDRLAQEGISFTDAHSPSAVCTPTRYGLLTGRYCWRSRLKSGVLNGMGAPLIEPERPTIASHLRAAGYRTAVVGKWHLGLGYARDAKGEVDWSGRVDGGPLDLGFHESFVIPASLDFTPYCYVKGRRIPSPPTAEHPGGRFPDFVRKGPMSPDFDVVGCLDRLTDEACAFLVRQGRRQPPFFLYFPLTAPHKPVSPDDRFVGRTGLGPYADFVCAVDHAVGRVLETLDETGLAEDTLVIVTSDNGSFMYRRDDPEARDHVDDPTIQAYRADRHRANGPWRGTKADVWEAGHRVPYLVRWPGVAPAGTVEDTTICHVDLFATLAAVAGRPLETGAAPDSADVSALLRGEALAAPRGPVVHHSANGMFAIREGPWKLVAGNGSGGRQQPKGKPFERPFQLFDVETDPGETTNLIDAHPDVASRLEGALEALRTNGS